MGLRTHVFLGVVAMTAVHCGGSESPPRTVAQPPPSPYGTYSTNPAPPPAPPPIARTPGPVSPFGAILSDPRGLQGILAGALAGGSAAFGSMMGGEGKIIEQGIIIKARTDAQGMTATTQLMTARLGAGRHAHATFTLEPGRCYTVVGFSAPGVFDYQLHLIAAPPLPPQVLAQSPTGRPDPTLGHGTNCIRNPYGQPVVVTIDMHVRSGQGLVGAQPFHR